MKIGDNWKGRKIEGKSLLKGILNRKILIREGFLFGKIELRERDLNGKDEVGIGNVEVEWNR